MSGSGIVARIPPLTDKKALKECEYRLGFVGNLYGDGWVREVPLLKACIEALKEKMQTKPVPPYEDVPKSEEPVLGLIEADVYVKDGIRTRGAKKVMECVLTYSEEEGWETVPKAGLEFTVLLWRGLQEWGAKEIMDASEKRNRRGME